MEGHKRFQFDVIAGGFPCQDISIAGKGEGIEGERSSLWFEMLRSIRLVRPRHVIVENVPMLLFRGMDTVLGGLAESGYNAEWDCIPAASVGAPHRRDRVFVVANPRYECRGNDERGTIKRDGRGELEKAPVANTESQPQREPATQTNPITNGRGTRDEPCRRRESVADAQRSRQPQPEGGEQDQRGWIINGGQAMGDTNVSHEGHRHNAEGAVFKDIAEGNEGCRASLSDTGQGAIESRMGRGTNGISSGLDGHLWPSGQGDFQYEWEPPRTKRGVKNGKDRLKALGNAVVPQVVEYIGRRIAGASDGGGG